MSLEAPCQGKAIWQGYPTVGRARSRSSESSPVPSQPLIQAVRGKRKPNAPLSLPMQQATLEALDGVKNTVADNAVMHTVTQRQGAGAPSSRLPTYTAPRRRMGAGVPPGLQNR